MFYPSFFAHRFEFLRLQIVGEDGEHPLSVFTCTRRTSIFSTAWLSSLTFNIGLLFSNRRHYLRCFLQVAIYCKIF